LPLNLMFHDGTSFAEEVDCRYHDATHGRVAEGLV
jgi:hypothetical protein